MRFILGTAGHIDHGKSSLIKALTGINPDRLPEEQKRGVTIELGFAHLELGGHEIGVVDVPGHADFVNNMVSGVGPLDLALFVVAADDGWMPQSEEHLHILHYLGVKNIIIALTKIDRCEDQTFIEEMLREEIAGTSIENAPIVPVSAHTGEGLDTLKEAIVNAAKKIKHDVKGRQARLHVDRVFSPKGVGTVVTGSLIGSEMSLGDSLICYPLQQRTNLRHIQMHNNQSDTASPGSRVGLNLSDIAIDTRGKPGIKRGCLLAPVGLQLTQTIDVKLERLGREINGQTATKRPLKNTESVILHIGTARVKSRIILQEKSTLATGEATFAQLRLAEPVALFLGERFVLRDGAQQGTLGGGIVLEAIAEERKFRTKERHTFLQSRTEAMDTPRNLLLNELHFKKYRPEQNPLINTSYSKTAIDQAAQKLIKEKKIQQKGHFLIEKTWWNDTLNTAEKLIQQFHADHPDESVMPLEQWRKELQHLKLNDALIQEIEQLLLSTNYTKKEFGIGHKDHQLELPTNLQNTADQLTNILQKSGIHPPIIVELLDSEEKKQAMLFLIKNKTVTELSPKALLLTSVLDDLIEQVITFIATNKKATSSEIRQHIGATRKVLIPLLELMDARNITKRDGDYRELSNS